MVRVLSECGLGRGREALWLHGALEQTFGVGAQFAVGANPPRAHPGVGVDLFAEISETASAVAPVPRARGREPQRSP